MALGSKSFDDYLAGRKAKREAALKQIWREMHRDYKSKLADGTKSVLVLRSGGTTLVPLDLLTDAEIAQRVKGYEA